MPLMTCGSASAILVLIGPGFAASAFVLSDRTGHGPVLRRARALAAGCDGRGGAWRSATDTARATAWLPAVRCNARTASVVKAVIRGPGGRAGVAGRAD